MTHPGHELVFGLAGRCVYEVAGREYWVGPGDSLVLDSRQPHRALNAGRGQAQLLLALYATEQAPAWLERHVRSSRAPRRVRSRRRPLVRSPFRRSRRCVCIIRFIAPAWRVPIFCNSDDA